MELDCLVVEEDFCTMVRTPDGLMRAEELQKRNTTRWDGPQYGTYNAHAARLRSYDNWPCALKQKPAQLSEGGFFYTGKSL